MLTDEEMVKLREQENMRIQMYEDDVSGCLTIMICAGASVLALLGFLVYVLIK